MSSTGKHSTDQALDPTVIDSVASPIMVLDARYKVIRANPAAAQLLGYQDSQQLLGQQFVNLLGKTDTADFLRTLTAGTNSSHTIKQELAMRRNDSSRFHAELQINSIRFSRRRLYICTLHDLTQPHQFLENMRLAKEQAEAANRAKSDFLVVISNEVRTPLNAILGTLNLILNSPLSEEQRTLTETAYEAGGSLLSIINDTLDFSKIEAGHLELEFSDFDVVQLVEGVVESLAPSAYTKSIALDSLIDQDVPRLLHSDSGRLRQILLNLVGNAIKFTNRGGAYIRVSVEKLMADQTILRFSVTDTGIGIAATSQANLFERFTQSDASHSRRSGGAGLGLAISRRLVDYLGGHIGFNSTPEQGSTFWFTVPCSLVSRSAENIEDASPLIGMRALIVENNPVSRQVHVLQLRQWGMEVTTATSGASALKALRDAHEQQQPFQVALIDQILSDMNGNDLGRIVLATKELTNTRMVLMATMGTPAIISQTRRIGFHAFLIKPIRQASLYRWVSVAAELAARSEQEQALSDEIAYGETAEKRNKRLLLVEDSHVNQISATATLRKAGYQIDAVDNGLEALQILRTFSYDLVLMDLAMPEMDGFEATARIRQLSEPLCNIPIIAVSANVLPEDRERLLKLGINDYVVKPLNREHLLSVIDHWLASSKSTTEPTPMEELLDLETLQRLEQETAPEVMYRIINLFVDETRARLQKIIEARAQENWLQLQRAAHGLKSAAGTFGAKCLHKQAKALEQACDVGNHAQCREVTERLIALTNETLIAITEYNTRNQPAIAH